MDLFGMRPSIRAVVLFVAVGLNLCCALEAGAGGFGFKDFRIEGVGAMGEGSSFSGLVSYLPSYGLIDNLDIKGNVGVSVYRGVDQLVPVVNTGLLISYRVVEMLALEVGGGAQTWSGSGSAAMVNANVNWVPSSPILGSINKVVAGYSRVQFTAPVDEVRVGVELNFGTVISGASESATPRAAAQK